MTHVADLFSFGNPGETVSAELNPRIHFHSEIGDSIQHVTSEQLNRLVDHSHAEIVGFRNASYSKPINELDNALDQLEVHPETAAVLVAQQSPSSPFDHFLHFPCNVALLIEPPETRGTILYRKSAISEKNTFTDCSLPLWQRLLQFAQEDAVAVICSETPAPSEALAEEEDYLPVLAPDSPGSEHDWLLDHLERLPPEDLVNPITSLPDAVALKAGLLQIHDFLDESHTASQSVEGAGHHAAGDYWHGIMHRREPDDSNAKYWFRRVGQHPVFGLLAEQARGIFQTRQIPNLESWEERCLNRGGWDPYAFIDFCSDCRRTKNESLNAIARRIQWVEMLLLLKQTYEDAST